MVDYILMCGCKHSERKCKAALLYLSKWENGTSVPDVERRKLAGIVGAVLCLCYFMEDRKKGIGRREKMR